jgi:hypothetical protein
MSHAHTSGNCYGPCYDPIKPRPQKDVEREVFAMLIDRAQASALLKGMDIEDLVADWLKETAVGYLTREQLWAEGPRPRDDNAETDLGRGVAGMHPNLVIMDEVMGLAYKQQIEHLTAEYERQTGPKAADGCGSDDCTLC